MLRCGSGVGQAFFNSDENIYGRGVFTAMDVARCSALFATLAGPGVRFVESPIGCRANLKLTEISGREIKFSNDFRVAPFGNRTSPPHPIGKWPHYHRQGPQYTKGNKKGLSLPGQAMKRHRPWEKSPFDKSIKDRF